MAPRGPSCGLEHGADAFTGEKPLDRISRSSIEDRRAATRARRDEARLDLRQHAALDRAVVDELLRALAIEVREDTPCLRAHARHVSDEDKKARAQARGDRARGTVRVDVE